METSGDQEAFERWITAKLHEAVDEYEPPNVLSELIETIRRHSMKFIVHIKTSDKVPKDWPYESIDVVVYAPNAEEAEEMGDNIIGLLEDQEDVDHSAMVIDSLHEVS